MKLYTLVDIRHHQTFPLSGQWVLSSKVSQLREALNISYAREDLILNSKTEFGANFIVTSIVDFGRNWKEEGRGGGGGGAWEEEETSCSQARKRKMEEEKPQEELSSPMEARRRKKGEASCEEMAPGRVAGSRQRTMFEMISLRRSQKEMDT